MAFTALVLDDHPLARLGLRVLLMSEQRLRIETVHEAPTIDRAVELASEHQPDAACVDLWLGDPNADGISACRRILATSPETEIVVYTAAEGLGVVNRAQQAGARGVVSKIDPGLEVVKALHFALRGQPYVSRFFLSSEAVPDLPPRQRQILQLISQGKHYPQIAEDLGISEETVRTHVKRLVARLGASDRSEAVAIGLRNALIS